MRFRSKLLLLLLIISLAPLLLLRCSNQSAVHEMGEEIARRIRAQLIERSSSELKQRVADHAFVMSRERQLLELALQTQATATLEFLEGEPPYPSVADIESLDPDEQAKRHCQLRGNGSCPAEETSYKGFTILDSAPGSEEKQEQRLKNLAPVFSNIAARFQDLVLWQYLALPLPQNRGSTLAVFPSTGLRSTPQGMEHMGRGSMWMRGKGSQDNTSMQRRGMSGRMMGGPWTSENSMGMTTLPAWHTRAIEAGKPVWSLPEQDPLTRKLVVIVSMPVFGHDHEVLGSTALVVLADALLHSQRHAAMFSEQQQTLMVYPEQASDPADYPAGAETDQDDPQGPALRILARTSAPEEAAPDHDSRTASWNMRSWQAPETDQWVESTDAEALALVVSDMRKGKVNVRRLPYEGRPSLWAYGPIKTGGAALLIITPQDILTADAEKTQEYILNQFQQTIVFSGLLVGVVILLIVLLALVLTRRMTRRIEDLAGGFEKVAKGDFSIRLPVSSKDEIGQLAMGFNAMVPELEERFELHQSLEVAHEIQRSLLPHSMPQTEGFDLAGTCVYSESTGGDYYDVICPSNVIVCSLDGRPQSVPAPDAQDTTGPELIGLAVGDVTGHGLIAALLMTTGRAFLRQRASLPGGPGEVLADVNRQFYGDVKETGRFMTMFYAVLEPKKRLLRWARAGHEPALLYDPGTGEFSELLGEGLPLGTVEDWPFDEQERTLSPGQLVCIATDGLWEAENSRREMYGKERLKELLRDNAEAPSEDIMQAVLKDLRGFLGLPAAAEPADDTLSNALEDDVTLLLLKVL